MKGATSLARFGAKHVRQPRRAPVSHAIHEAELRRVHAKLDSIYFVGGGVALRGSR